MYKLLRSKPQYSSVGYRTTYARLPAKKVKAIMAQTSILCIFQRIPPANACVNMYTRRWACILLSQWSLICRRRSMFIFPLSGSFPFKNMPKFSTYSFSGICCLLSWSSFVLPYPTVTLDLLHLVLMACRHNMENNILMDHPHCPVGWYPPRSLSLTCWIQLWVAFLLFRWSSLRIVNKTFRTTNKNQTLLGNYV